MNKKVAVYYRSLPLALLEFVNGDGNMSLIKDGARSLDGHSVPRATVIVKGVSENQDKKRVAALDRLLETLERNNQIVSYGEIK